MQTGILLFVLTNHSRPPFDPVTAPSVTGVLFLTGGSVRSTDDVHVPTREREV